VEIKVVNETRGVTLAERAQRAENIWSRFVGLMGKASFPEGSGLEITQCAGIHTFFMRFPIDVLFLDDAGKVIRAIPDLRPWRATGIYITATRTVELPAGTIARTGTTAGDRVEVTPLPPR
jgi:uncharacterized membrane protein (UPF0127 family)